MPLRPPTLAILLLVLAGSTHAERVTHRWSFNQTGSAASGRVLPDAIASAPAVIRGTGATLSGTTLTLPGTTTSNQTPQAISAYVDLPNGIISSRTNLTIEIWATIQSRKNWQRLFEFGRISTAGDGLGAPGEITGGGTSAAGNISDRDSLVLSVNRDNADNRQHFAGGIDGTETFANTTTTLAYGTRYHFIATFTAGLGNPAGGRISWYKDGAFVTSADLPFPLSSLEDVNNWLGRSQWANDSNAHISYDELRLYDEALTPARITASRDAGPNAVIPAVLPAYALTMNHGGQTRIELLADASGEVVPSTFAIEQLPLSGSAIIRPDGSILYTHTTGSPASDSFVAKVANSAGQFATATVTITFSDDLRFANPHLNVPSVPPANALALEPAFGALAFNKPVCLASPPGETRRLFVCEQGGLLRVIPDVTASTPTASTFLNLSGIRSVNSSSESGLLGLAFHPAYATNRHFYIFYSVNNGGLRQRVSRFTTQAGNPNAADTTSELILLEQADEAGNHNGGDLHFGPDGYLYISVGDEGAADDSLNNSQTINKDLFSGILRLDVDKLSGNVAPTAHPSIPTDGGVARFSIPKDNPFVHTSLGGPWNGTYNGGSVSQTTVRREFFATGLRNPWRMSFDPLTGELWCGDVGQNALEEVNLIAKGGNYGWAFYEAGQGGAKFGQAPANFDTLYHSRPLYQYPRSGIMGGYSITGGLVYHGTRLASLTGKYIFGDYGSGNIWALDRNGGGTPSVQRIAGEGGITAFGTDPSNQDVLLADYDNNRLLRLVLTTADSFPTTLTATGLFANLESLSPSPGLFPYNVNLPFWSDHAVKQRWFIIPDGMSRFTSSQDDPWTLPNGTIWVKHFDLELTRGNPATKKRLETRLLVKNTTGAYGVSYRWNEAGTEATLAADGGEEFDVSINDGGNTITQTWNIPSRAACLICHTPQAGHALSFNTRQLNRPGDLAGVAGNQLAALFDEDFLTNHPGSPNLLPRHLAPSETAFSLEGRVRSYLAVNCAYCHQTGGTAGTATWDGRPELTLAETGLLLGEATNNGGNSDNKLIVPDHPERSIVLQRTAATNDFTRMPPLASNLTDPAGIALLTDWITLRLPARQSYSEWRLARFGSSNSPQGEPGFDADLDGYSNEEEFLRGTLPLNPASLPTLLLEADPGLRFQFTLPENRSFRWMSSTDLSTWTPWDIPGNNALPAPGGPQLFTAPNDTPWRFFTLEVSEN